jgi:hypothetical protein
MQSGHELDARLANKTLFAWFRPTLEIAIRQLQVTLGAGFVLTITQILLARLPWPYSLPWWVVVLRVALESLVLSLVFVAGYRLLAERESRGTALEVNAWQPTMICAAQVSATWTVIGWVVAGALLVVGKAISSAAPSLGSAGILVVLVYGSIALAILMFLLAPIWATLGAASALSTVHAVRSLDNGLGAVLSSLRIAFEQKWRVFWPSYVIALLLIGAYALSWYSTWVVVVILGPILRYVPIVLWALALALTFVIERAYAPDLGLAVLGDGPDESPAAPAPAPANGPATATSGAAPPAPDGVAAAPVAAAAKAASTTKPATTAADAAALIDQDLRANRADRLVGLAESGLAADARFFVGHTDQTTGLAKKLAQTRPDLALRVLQPYLKEQRGHRFHLTGALLVANILLRDPRRLADAAKFLAQVKTMYPDEPMVDQLIKTAHKAIAATAGPSPA